MAERRMFHTAVVGSDAFLELPAGAQALYFHLGMNADDDGFINSPKQITRKLGRPAKELQLLIDKGFLLNFDGIVVIKHWRVANSWKTDRIQLPRYPEIAEKVFIKPDKAYTLTKKRGLRNLLQEKRFLAKQHGIRLDSAGIPRREEKKREEKNIKEKNIEENSIEQKKAVESAQAGLPALTYDDSQKENDSVISLELSQVTELMEIMGLDDYCKYRLKLERFIRENDAHIQDHYATILKWWEEDRR